MLEQIKVGAKTSTGSLAGAIANSIRTNGATTVTCVGAQALYQAVCGLALAQRFLENDRLDIFTQYLIETKTIDEEGADPKTVIAISVTSRHKED